MTARAVLGLKGVSKTFPGVVALEEVSLEVSEGEVHALLGENGAGKSTLMAIAAGAMAANSGTIEIGGIFLDAASPSRAQELGIAVVYQHTSVLHELTVAENLLYCVPKERRSATINTYQWISEQLALVGAVFDRRTRVGELGVAERQLVEIAKALALQPKVLVLDEPTEALTAKETEQLFVNIERITALGTAVVYISHRLPEVKRVADRITVLRDGKVCGTFLADNISEREILSSIIGRPVDHAFPEKGERPSGKASLLVARRISNGVLQSIDLEVAAGEVVGLAGVEGNGQREFIRSLAGLVSAAGELTIDGKRAALCEPIRIQDAGIVYLPGDRHSEGLFMSLSVRENIATLVLDTLSRLGLVSPRLESSLVARQIATLAIKTPSPRNLRISSLSGGNQQKVLFARSLSREPVVLLADEPTRGVDAGARIELYRILRKVAADGGAVVLLSSDAIELQGLCDRVLVFSRGQIAKTLIGDQITEENITRAAINADMQRKGTESDRHARREGLRRFISGDYAPLLILTALIVLLGLYTASVSEYFLTTRSISGALFLVSALAFVSMGQLIVLLIGGVDLSVGPLTGLTVVILSFFAGDDQGVGELFWTRRCRYRGYSGRPHERHSRTWHWAHRGRCDTDQLYRAAGSSSSAALNAGWVLSLRRRRRTSGKGWPIPDCLSDGCRRRSWCRMDASPNSVWNGATRDRVQRDRRSPAWRPGQPIRNSRLRPVLAVRSRRWTVAVGPGWHRRPSRWRQLFPAKHFGSGAWRCQHLWRSRLVFGSAGRRGSDSRDYDRKRISRPRDRLAVLAAGAVDPF